MRSTSDTTELTVMTARLEFSRHRRVRNTLMVGALGLIATAATAWAFLAAGPTPRRAMKQVDQQNAELRADLARTRIELALERSTRAALARQVAELDADNGELQRRLEFFNTQTGRSDASR